MVGSGQPTKNVEPRAPPEARCQLRKSSSPEISWPRRPRILTPNASASAKASASATACSKSPTCCRCRRTRTPRSCKPTPRRRSATVEGLQAAFDAAFPIVSHNGFVEMKFLEYNLAKPAFDVRECQTRGLTYASAVRAKVQLIIYDRESSTPQSKVGQGSEGARGLHGRSAPDDRQGLVHHQRHRARDRLAAAPLAGRVLRARQGQDPQLGQAAVLGAHHPVPRLLARLRVRPEGHPVLPRRPPPQDAGHDPAQGHRPDAGIDPGATSSSTTTSA